MASQPTKIGKYDVVRVIGRGGMGMVYQAIDPTIGRTVAIKSVTAVLSDDPDLLKRFYREAQSTGKLQHPNIVTAYDLGEQDGVPYLVMEYLEGDSLDKIIRERRPCTMAEKLHIIIQACEGLGYAHQRQIIHRDVKPGNIVVLNDGGVKIVDFGIAQFGNERYTRTGQIVGSLYYMSPEQIQDGDIDSRSDIYSTAVVLFEFLTGSLPFQGKDPTSTLAKILHEPPPSVVNLVPLCPREMDEVIQRALAKDRNNRYASMEDFAFELRSVQENLSRDLIGGFLQTAGKCIEDREWDKARDHLRQILNLDKQHRRANELLREVQSQIHKQQLSRQVRELRMRADEALMVRNWDEALRHLDQAVKIDGGNAELIEFRNSVRRSGTLLADALRRAETARDAGDLAAAKRAVEEALSIDPSNTTAKALNAILSKEISESSKRKKVDELIDGARNKIAVRHFTAALQLLRDAEAIDASAPEVQQLIRSASAGREHEQRRLALEKACMVIEDLLHRDEYALACDKADEALRSFPQDLGLLKLKGFAEKQREAWDRHRFVESQMAAAQRFLDSGQLAQAHRLLNDTLERYPDESGVISLLGIVTDSISRQEAQRREVERQVNERRHFIRLHLETAAELQRNGQTAQALKKIREGVSRYADSEELKSEMLALEEALEREDAARQRAAEDVRQKKAAIEKTIADSWQLLSSKQIAQAVVMLEQALLRNSDSAELKSQLEFAQRRMAVERAERERTEQEARQRQAEVQRQIAIAQRQLDTKQTGAAVATLEEALNKDPENEALRSFLQFARRCLAAEQAERQSAEMEAKQIQEETGRAMAAAQRLLDARQTSDAVELLQKAASRDAGSEELRSALEAARQRLLAEQAARKKAEEDERRRRAWIDAEITATRQFLNEKQSERAVTSLQKAVAQYPESEELKAELDRARRRLMLEHAERDQAAREAQQRREEIEQAIAMGESLLDSKNTDEAVFSLEKAVLKFPDSKELRSRLDLARLRQIEEEREKQRIVEEQRRKRVEIEREINSAQALLKSKQANRAVSDLQATLLKYPDNAQLRTQLEEARELLAKEEAERQKAAKQAQAKQKLEVERQIAVARDLLDSGKTFEAVASLKESLRRFPDIAELEARLDAANRRLAEEEAARHKIEEQRRRQAGIADAIAIARQLLDTNQTDRAVQALAQAVRSFPESDDLKNQLHAAQELLAAERAERERVEEEERRRQAEVQREITAARQLLDSKQTNEAVALLVRGSETFPQSTELRALLESARQRLAREREEKRQAEEQARRRQEEIEGQAGLARQLLQSNQTSKAVELLEQVVRKYPESERLRGSLLEAQGQLRRQRAEQEQSEREAQARSQKIAGEVKNARALLKSKQTANAAAALEEAVRRYPESEELHSLLASVQEQLAREKAERERAEKRDEQLQAERARIRSLLREGGPERALQAVDTALKSFGKDPVLQELMDAAKAALKRKNAEEKERAAKRQQVEEQKRQRDRDLVALRELATSLPALSKPSSIEKQVRKAREIATRYPDDAEIQECLAETIGRLKAPPVDHAEKSESSNTRLATRLFAPGTPPQAETAPAERQPHLPNKGASVTIAGRLLNKWTILPVLGLLAAGLIARYRPTQTEEQQPARPSHANFVLSLETQPAGASIQIGAQSCVTPNCRLSLPPGEYQIQARLPGYQPFSQSLVVNSTQPPPPLKLVLVPEPSPETAGILLIKAGIADADVVINGKNYSQTSSEGALRLRLMPGIYNVEIQKKGYEAAKPQRVQVNTGKEMVAEFNLRALPSKLVIAGAPQNVRVLVDGHDQGATDGDGAFSYSLAGGEHQIALVNGGRQSNQIRRNFVLGESTSISGKDFIFSQPPAVARVLVTKLPNESLVQVDGGETYKASSSGEVRFEVSAGNHTLKVTKEGFNPKTIQQTFAAGGAALDGSLEPDPEQQEWAKVEGGNDSGALETFLGKYPAGRHAEEAKDKLDKLTRSKGGGSTGNGTKNYSNLTDSGMISDTLGQLERAYYSKNVGEVCAIWPGCPRKEFEKVFKDALAVSIKFQPSAPPEISGELASVVCRRVRVTTYKGSPPMPGNDTVIVHLRKQNGRWLVDSIKVDSIN